MFLLQQNQRLENRCATYELQVQRLEAELQRLKKLELEVAELRERLGQNSQNSSKPPSSDPPSVSRPNKHQPSGRKRGGQRGHQGHGRTLLPPDQVDHIVNPLKSHELINQNHPLFIVKFLGREARHENGEVGNRAQCIEKHLEPPLISLNNQYAGAAVRLIFRVYAGRWREGRLKDCHFRV